MQTTTVTGLVHEVRQHYQCLGSQPIALVLNCLWLFNSLWSSTEDPHRSWVVSVTLFFQLLFDIDFICGSSVKIYFCNHLCPWFHRASRSGNLILIMPTLMWQRVFISKIQISTMVWSGSFLALFWNVLPLSHFLAQKPAGLFVLTRLNFISVNDLHMLLN